LVICIIDLFVKFILKLIDLDLMVSKILYELSCIKIKYKFSGGSSKSFKSELEALLVRSSILSIKINLLF